MALYTSIEPIELTDDELKAVAGGFHGSFSITNSTNSGNNSGNFSATNAFNNNINSLNNS